MKLTPPRALALPVMVRGMGWNAKEPIRPVTSRMLEETLKKWS